jgi:hypothetical protein
MQPMICVDDGVTTLINIFTVEPENRQKLIALLKVGTTEAYRWRIRPRLASIGTGAREVSRTYAASTGLLIRESSVRSRDGSPLFRLAILPDTTRHAYGAHARHRPVLSKKSCVTILLCLWD